jgi:hypothetical protein
MEDSSKQVIIETANVNEKENRNKATVSAQFNELYQENCKLNKLITQCQQKVHTTSLDVISFSSPFFFCFQNSKLIKLN